MSETTQVETSRIASIPSLNTSRYQRAVAVGFAIFALVILALLAYQYQTHRKIYLKSIRDSVAERCTILDGVLTNATNHVYMMKDLSEFFLQIPADVPSVSPIVKDLRLQASQGCLSLDSLDPKTQKAVGNLFLIPDGFQGDPLSDREVQMSVSLFKMQSIAMDLTPYFAWTYYVSKRNFFALYPWISLKDFVKNSGFSDIKEAIPHQYEMDLWLLGSPEKNPQRKAFWTKPYVDMAGKGLVVTHGAPVYNGDTFVGVVAADITLGFLRQTVEPFRHPNSRLMIVDYDKNLLAHSDYVPQAQTTIPTLKEVLPPALKESLTALPLDGKMDRQYLNRYNVTMLPMKKAPWVLIHIVPESDLIRAFLPTAGVYLLAVLILFGSLTANHFLINRHFVRPAIALANHVRQEVLGEPAPVPAVPSVWEGWFKHISDTFALKAVTENLPGAIYQIVREGEEDLVLNFISAGARNLLGTGFDGLTLPFKIGPGFLPEEDLPAFVKAFEDSARAMSSLMFECSLPGEDGRCRWVRFVSKPRSDEGSQVIWEGLMLDVTEKKQDEQDREKLIKELQDAFTQLKVLKGLLPICMSCKKIRDDKGYWNQIESYLQEHSDAEFTHGICPECKQKVLSDYQQFQDSTDQT